MRRNTPCEKCRFMKIYALILLAAIVILAPQGVWARETFKTGDLIFQDLDCGELCDAIENVTKAQFCVDGPALSHVGVVIGGGRKISVLEAYDGSVTLTPIEKVLARPQNDTPKIIHLESFHGLPKGFSKRIASVAPRYVGRGYDDYFDIDNNSYYCSELVYEIFKRANGGKEFFHLLPMTFGKAGSKEHGVWKKYFDGLGMPIPEGRPGISPLGIWLEASEVNKK